MSKEGKNIPVTDDKILDLLLENRNVKTKKEKEAFLNPELEDVTIKNVGIDPSEVKKSLKRIKDAIEANETIIVFGDYDVDGITGTAILWETIYRDYKNVFPHIPHRVDEGYGLSIKGIDHVLSSYPDTRLIITVDNGIVASDAVDYANEKGIDVIITDHHVRGVSLPNASSIVHTTKICGSAVAYILSKEISQAPSNHLELAALATVADLVPLTGASRAIVKFGILALRKTNRIGLLELLSEAALKRGEVDVYRIGHVIAPRLNASGRIAHAMDSLRLLCTKDRNRAKELARSLGETNKSRQTLTQEATEHADLVSEQIDLTHKFIFVHNADYNPGVIGLVASRLVEKHYRPSIAVSVGEKVSKGSARSIAGFNIIEYIRTFQEFLVDAGGHPMAAGFTVETSRLEEFRNAMIAGSHIISDELLERTLTIDCELSFENISLSLYKEIQKLAPFGMNNLEPLFVSKKVIIDDMKLVGKEKNHVKMKLMQNGKTLDAILFSGQEFDLKIGQEVDLVYTVDNNSWNGMDKIDLKIRDVNHVDAH